MASNETPTASDDARHIVWQVDRRLPSNERPLSAFSNSAPASGVSHKRSLSSNDTPHSMALQSLAGARVRLPSGEIVISDLPGGMAALAR